MFHTEGRNAWQTLGNKLYIMIHFFLLIYITGACINVNNIIIELVLYKSGRKIQQAMFSLTH